MTHGHSDADIAAMRSRFVWLCDRRTGIGADGVIFVLEPTIAEAQFRMRIFNNDASEAEMCGNGIRCFHRYCLDAGLTDRDALTIETGAGLIRTALAGEEIRVDMGRPILEADRIPTRQTQGQVIDQPLEVQGRVFRITAVSMGNPHAVIFTDELTDELVWQWGRAIETHPFFPRKVNVEFIQVLSSSEVRMRVWERGCGETQACGTGACAAAVAGILNRKHGNEVTVHLPGGDLLIQWDGNREHSVFMTGPAVRVFTGEAAFAP
jgi:diaminopimelate epimerase